MSAVSVDDRSATETIQGFLNELGIRFPVYHDPSWAIVDDYFLLGLPGTFLVDSQGKIVRKWTGPLEPMAEDVQADILAVLEQ